MQKVITISTHTNVFDSDQGFIEKEYPILNSYLEQGYVVTQVVPITPSSTNTYMYSLTFVLHKA